MKRKALALICQILICTTIINAQSKPNGTGSADDPFQISTPEELQWVCSNEIAWDKNLVIVNDIDITASASWNQGRGFVPIGTKYSPFTGVLDGYNKTITGLTINRPDSSYIAFIGYAGDEAEIKDLSLENATITGLSKVGSLAGNIDSLVTVNNCTASGNVKGSKIVGGLIGASKGTIDKCQSEATSHASTKWSGGLIGLNMGIITRCSSSGNASAVGSVGGFVGMNQSSGLINECFATGNSDGVDNSIGVGGFVGINNGGVIKSCYSSGKAGGKSSIGGFAGATMKNGKIWCCYATGRVNCTGIGNSTGGFVGSCTMTKIEHCYTTSTSSVTYGYGGFAGLAVLANFEACFFDIKLGGTKVGSGSNKTEKGITGLKTKAFVEETNFKGWPFDGSKDKPWTLPAEALSPALYWQHQN